MINSLRERFEDIEEKTNLLTSRERIIIAGAGAVIILAVFDQLIMAPLLEQRKELKEKTTSAQESTFELQSKVAALEAQIANHPNRRAKKKINELNSLHGRVDQQINDITSHLISPQQMSRLMNDLLSESSGLQVTNVTTTPAEQVMVSDSTQTQSLALFRHDLELTLTGSYFEVINYLQTVESLPSRIIWDELVYTVESYPKGTLKLSVHTLSSGEDLFRVNQ